MSSTPPSSLQGSHKPHMFIHTGSLRPSLSLRPTLSLACVQTGWVIPQDEASCFDNSCEAQCLLQHNTDCPIISKMSALSSLLHQPKEDQVAFTLCDPLTRNRNILSTGIMIPFVFWDNDIDKRQAALVAPDRNVYKVTCCQGQSDVAPTHSSKWWTPILYRSLRDEKTSADQSVSGHMHTL